MSPATHEAARSTNWQELTGHEEVREQFRRSLRQGRLATTFLFVGPEGIGKRTFALHLAQALLCTERPEQEFSPCRHCEACTQVSSGTHPDLITVSKPEDKAFIPVETFIGDREHRMRTGLCHFMSLTPTGGKRRIAIIDDADWLNQEGANSLLKTLEEPSPSAIIILISTSVQRQLPTIRSRCQVIRFRPLTPAQVERCLARIGVDDVASDAAATTGSVSQSLALADGELHALRTELLEVLGTRQLDRKHVAELVQDYVDAGGKQAAQKRPRLLAAIRVVLGFYRACLRAEVDRLPPGDPHAKAAARLRGSDGIDQELLASLIERCADAMSQTRANANLSLAIDTWVADLSSHLRSGHPRGSARTD